MSAPELESTSGDDGDTFSRMLALEDYLTTELEQPWTDEHVVRLRDKLYNKYRQDAEAVYTCMKRRLMDVTSDPFARMNLLFILDKLCIEASEPKHDYYPILLAMRTDFAQVLNRVVDIGDEDPPNKKPNVNLGWTKEILMGWRKRRLFASGDIDAFEIRLRVAESLPFSSRTDVQYENEKVERRMEADRDRQKKDKEDAFLRRALSPWEELADTWFFDTPENGTADFWASTDAEIHQWDLEYMDLENLKYRTAGKIHAMTYQPALRTASPPPPPMPYERPPMPPYPPSNYPYMPPPIGMSPQYYSRSYSTPNTNNTTPSTNASYRGSYDRYPPPMQSPVFPPSYDGRLPRSRSGSGPTIGE